MQLDDFNFVLPDDLIAKYPLAKRSQSRLLYVQDKVCKHYTFQAVTDLLAPGDLLILNDTKVLPARLLGHKKSGGKIELLLERILNENRLLAQLKANKPIKIGTEIIFHETVLVVVAKHQEFFELEFKTETAIRDLFVSFGKTPLPPYLRRLAVADDCERYQTVYAKHVGSVAAPTAGLHFDHALINNLQNKGVQIAYLTLHIGAGTFSPIRTKKIYEHKMHTENFSISKDLCEQIRLCKSHGKRVIAVGTTTLRALESASAEGEVQPYCGETNIFIYPGYQFKSPVDALITNFHLPKSSLLMLVAAFAGLDTVMHAYHTAISESYRFYSYGDAMWLTKFL